VKAWVAEMPAVTVKGAEVMAHLLAAPTVMEKVAVLPDTRPVLEAVRA